MEITPNVVFVVHGLPLFLHMLGGLTEASDWVNKVRSEPFNDGLTLVCAYAQVMDEEGNQAWQPYGAWVDFKQIALITVPS